VLVLAGSVAWAAIRGEGGVYTACMLRNVGTVRLIDKSLPPGNLMSHCKPALEVEVSWNQHGAQGIQGPKGDKGDTGDQGIQGVQGIPGPAGEQGLQGLAGEPGQNGASGYEIVESSIIGFPPGVAATRSVACPLGKKAVGGGAFGGQHGVLGASQPLVGGDIWTAFIRNASASETTQTQAFAVCAVVG
jgi:hypothetical protein